MKFEKFLKGCGTHGEVVERVNGEKWLVCGGVGMVIPKGVDTLLGKEWDKDYGSVVDVLADAEYDDPLTLKEAVIFNPSGNANSIYRVFESEFGERVGIINADFGLLEKKDLLGYGEIELPAEEDKEALTVKYVLVYDQTGNIQGFITGSDKF